MISLMHFTLAPTNTLQIIYGHVLIIFSSFLGGFFTSWLFQKGARHGSAQESLALSVEQGEDLEGKIKRMATEIIDMAVHMTLDFCVDNVMAKDDTELLDTYVDITSNEVDTSLAENPVAVIVGPQLADPMAMVTTETTMGDMAAAVLREFLGLRSLVLSGCTK